VTGEYAFIDAEYAAQADDAPTIGQICRWLGVSRSGYYEWRTLPASATAHRREPLKLKIKALFDASDDTSGYRRLHAAQVRGGERVGRELRALMRQLGLVACQLRPFRSTTTLPGKPASTLDLVGRDSPPRGRAANSSGHHLSAPARARCIWPRTDDLDPVSERLTPPH
jgi:putative transposase